MARVIANGRITNAKGNFTRGDGIEGSEQDLQPLVDTGAARWEGDDPPPEWPLSSTPSEYLARYPDGPNAELAREILAAEEED